MGIYTPKTTDEEGKEIEAKLQRVLDETGGDTPCNIDAALLSRLAADANAASRHAVIVSDGEAGCCALQCERPAEFGMIEEDDRTSEGVTYCESCSVHLSDLMTDKRCIVWTLCGGRHAMNAVFDDIRAERARQDEKWGGPEHDDEHGPRSWRRFIRSHLAKSERRGEYRQRILEVAALAVAAIESYDRTE
jgi:hypothetical protein